MENRIYIWLAHVYVYITRYILCIIVTNVNIIYILHWIRRFCSITIAFEWNKVKYFAVANRMRIYDENWLNGYDNVRCSLMNIARIYRLEKNVNLCAILIMQCLIIIREAVLFHSYWKFYLYVLTNIYADRNKLS